MKRLLLFPLLLLVAACGSESGVNEENSCTPGALPGDLVITEFLPNPIGTDEGGEWVEVYNASSISQCLNGVKLQVTGTKSEKDYYIVSTEPVVVEPGAYIVLAEADIAQPSYVFSKALAMPNTSGTVTLTLGGEELDSVRYGDVEGSLGAAPAEGKSLALCGECLTSSCNDAADSWSVTLEQPYDQPGNAGSPASANATCDCLPPEGTTSLRAPLPGDLAFTEVFADAPGEDGNQEWFEIHVLADDAAIDLSGVGIVTTKGADPAVLIPDSYCFSASPSQWLVFGRSADETANGGVSPDYVYGSKITLKNTSGYLALTLGGTVLAETTWASAPAGRSLQLDPDSGEWCESALPFGTNGGFGSPGDANLSCSESTCMLDGTPVQALAPAAGDLRINEIMANTPGAEAAEAEWIELLVAGSSPVDLNGLELWKADADKPAHLIETTDAHCLRFQPGDIILLARSNDPTKNGIPADSVDYVYSSLTLNNEGSIILKSGSVVIDEVAYNAADDGVALARDPSTGSWCPATKPIAVSADKTAYGTPGEENSACGALFCLDAGVSRPVSFPAPGTVTITELFADPAGTDKAAAEWLEISFTAEAAGRDLNGIELWINGELEASFGSGLSECTPAVAGPVLIAGSSDPALNGNLQNVVIALPQWSLPNSAATYTLKANGAVLDEVSLPAPDSGESIQLDVNKTSPEANDSADAWCPSLATYNDLGDKGTPGAANLPCNETLCTTGDNQMVTAIPPKPGDLIITEVFPNTPGSEDANKEWIEVYVPATADTFHLQGVGVVKTAGSAASFVFSALACIEMVPGNYYVLCRNAATEQNGGLPSCIPYESVALNNDGYLGLDLGGTLLDQVPAYGPAEDGASWSLDPDSLSVEANDTAANWCSAPATSTYGTGSRGTPGIANPQCP